MAVVCVIPYSWIPDAYFQIEAVFVAVEASMQVMICYICLSMGTDIRLRKNRCVLRESASGGLDIAFESIETEECLQSEIDLLADYKRGMSEYNKKCCDEIM